MITYLVTDKTRTAEPLYTAPLFRTVINSAKPLTILTSNDVWELCNLIQIVFGCSTAITATLSGQFDGTNWIQIKTETFTGFKQWDLNMICKFPLKLEITTGSASDISCPVEFFIDENFWL